MATNKDASGASGGSTVIGPSILINGKLSGEEDLTVRGRVEGELTLTKTLIVEPSGVIKANVTVKNAIVSGVVVGNIRASESVELTKEGRMVGDIASPRVILVDGASFRGRIEMGEEAARAASERASRAPARASARPAGPPRPPPPPARIDARTKNHAKPSAPLMTKLEGRPSPPAPPVIAMGGKRRVVVKKRER
jgi:cytoskeletal protein CcmA (bactofilin family)